jgi:hypothetical protein
LSKYRRGHLKLQAFKYIVSDPRTQGIPLVLETPNFDADKAVWGTEISVLKRFSTRVDTRTSPSDKLSRELDGGNVDGEDLERWAEEIQASVTVANQISDARKAAKEERAKARTTNTETKPRTKAAVGGPVQEAAGTIAKRKRQGKGNVQGGAMRRPHEGDEESELSELSLDGT